MARQNKASDIDFEIKFYENILKESPDFVEALMVSGELYTRAGFYEKGLGVDQRLSRLRPEDGTVFYNLACSYSLLNRIDEAVSSLARAIDLGYREWQFMSSDPDLKNLHGDNRFRELLEKSRGSKTPK